MKSDALVSLGRPFSLKCLKFLFHKRELPQSSCIEREHPDAQPAQGECIVECPPGDSYRHLLYLGRCFRSNFKNRLLSLFCVLFNLAPALFCVLVSAPDQLEVAKDTQGSTDNRNRKRQGQLRQGNPIRCTHLNRLMRVVVINTGCVKPCGCVRARLLYEGLRGW